MSVTFRILTRKEEMLPLFPLIHQLSPALSEADFSTRLDDMLTGNYGMAGAFDEGTGECVGISGFWIGTKLYSGKYLEMDNVVVDAAHRSAGIGKLLCDFLTDLARREGCEMLMLDAYLENEKAHAFYEREGFIRRGYHFLKKLDG